jgi:hypothetical protein
MSSSIKRIRIAAAAAVSTGVLVPLAVFAGPSFANGSASASQYQYGGKVTICHHAGKHGKTVTITISRSALQAHKRHGDSEGACPTVTTSTAAAATAAPTAPGNGHGKAKGHSK